jgi:hypothetical protein
MSPFGLLVVMSIDLRSPSTTRADGTPDTGNQQRRSVAPIQDDARSAESESWLMCDKCGRKLYVEKNGTQRRARSTLPSGTALKDEAFSETTCSYAVDGGTPGMIRKTSR